MIQKNIGEMIAILIKSKDITQTDLAEKIGVPHSQINPFLRGHKDVYASSLVAVLKEVGIDVEAQLKEKLKIENQIDPTSFKTKRDSFLYLFENLKEQSQETVISQMLWQLGAQESSSVCPELVNNVRKEFAYI